MRDIPLALVPRGPGRIVFRAVHVFFLWDVQTGLVWLLKIVTDPFHDVVLYHKAPLKLMAGRAHRSASATSIGVSAAGISVRWALGEPA